MKVCIFGAGAIGGYLAAHLAQVDGVSVSVVARGAHLNAIRRDGLVLESPAGTLRARIQASDHPRDLGPHGIRANCLAPGVMLTARVAAQAAARGIGTDAEAAKVPLRRLGQVEDCAGVLEFLATDLSQYVTGQVISVCGGAVLTPN